MQSRAMGDCRIWHFFGRLHRLKLRRRLFLYKRGEDILQSWTMVDRRIGNLVISVHRLFLW